MWSNNFFREKISVQWKRKSWWFKTRNLTYPPFSPSPSHIHRAFTSKRNKLRWTSRHVLYSKQDQSLYIDPLFGTDIENPNMEKLRSANNLICIPDGSKGGKTYTLLHTHLFFLKCEHRKTDASASQRICGPLSSSLVEQFHFNFLKLWKCLD